MAFNFHFRLSEDFSLILDDADDYNVIIQVGETTIRKNFVHIQLFYVLVLLISKGLFLQIGL